MNVHTIFTGIANTHLVASERGIVVIDAGMPRQARRIVNEIRARGHSPSDVRLILLTHGHIDHAGSAVALKRLTGAPIALHRADARLTATRDLKIPPGRNGAIDVAGGVLRAFGWMMPLETFTPDLWLEDGMSLRDFGIDARVVHTPGHTAGSVTLAFDDGTLFVGDALLNVLHVSFPLWWENPASARESACRIKALRPRVCYTGHGRPFDLNALEEFVGDHCG
jgi:hydroxyacylglutathione hydrolase